MAGAPSAAGLVGSSVAQSSFLPSLVEAPAALVPLTPPRLNSEEVAEIWTVAFLPELPGQLQLCAF